MCLYKIEHGMGVLDDMQNARIGDDTGCLADIADIQLRGRRNGAGYIQASTNNFSEENVLGPCSYFTGIISVLFRYKGQRELYFPSM